MAGSDGKWSVESGVTVDLYVWAWAPSDDGYRALDV